MKTRILIIVAFIFAVNFSFAQGCEDDAAPTGTASGVPSTSSITFFGYVQAQYSSEFLQPETTSLFHFKRARFGVRGRINRSFSYYASLEASDFVSSDGNPYLLDAFITWDKHEWTKISMGSFKQPFGRDVTTACHSLTTIERSMVANQLVVPQRDYGVMLLGGSSKTKFRYSLAFMNGTGIGVKEDNNKKKDIIGRATYQLFDFVNIGASFRYGYPTNNDDDRTTYGVDALVSYNKLTVQGEYIYDEGAYNLGADGGCGAAPLELSPNGRQGAYVMAAYKVTDKLQPVLKYEFFDADKDVKVFGYQEMFTVGINYFFHKKVRLQVNYQAKDVNGNSKDHNALLAQVQVRF